MFSRFFVTLLLLAASTVGCGDDDDDAVGDGDADADADADADGGSGCGDSVVDPDEACDDGNDDSTDECVSCQDARCGDGSVQVGHEVCDDGVNDGSAGRCSADCQSGPEGCLDVDHAQSFAGDMMGCGGSVTFGQRADLCGVGWHVCSATEWIARRGGVVPEDHYWSDDGDLGFASSGGTEVEPFACWVDHFGVVGINPCEADEPMRICAPGPFGDLPLQSDPIADSFDNLCNFINCGFVTYPPTEYFGGCGGNDTAGTLCCRQ